MNYKDIITKYGTETINEPESLNEIADKLEEFQKEKWNRDCDLILARIKYKLVILYSSVGCCSGERNTNTWMAFDSAKRFSGIWEYD